MKNNYRTIEIALYRGKSFNSKIIKWMSWGTYSHAAIRLPEDNGIIYEAWDGVGVRKGNSISDGHTMSTRVDLYALDVTHEQYKIIKSSLESQIGKKYDWKGVFRFSPLIRLFVSSSPSKSEQNKWFCSEYVAWALLQAGIHILQAPVWMISPSDLAKSPLLAITGTLYTAEKTKEN